MKEIVQPFLPKSASPKNFTDAPIIKLGLYGVLGRVPRLVDGGALPLGGCT